MALILFCNQVVKGKHMSFNFAGSVKPRGGEMFIVRRTVHSKKFAASEMFHLARCA